eukprot:222160_1
MGTSPCSVCSGNTNPSEQAIDIEIAKAHSTKKKHKETNDDEKDDKKIDKIISKRNEHDDYSELNSLVHTGWTRRYTGTNPMDIWLQLDLLKNQLSIYKHHINSYLWNEFIIRTNIHTIIKDDYCNIDEKTAHHLIKNLFDIDDIAILDKDVANKLVNVLINKNKNELQWLIVNNNVTDINSRPDELLYVLGLDTKNVTLPKAYDGFSIHELPSIVRTDNSIWSKYKNDVFPNIQWLTENKTDVNIYERTLEGFITENTLISMRNQTTDFLRKENIASADSNTKIIGDKYRMVWSSHDITQQHDTKLMNRMQILNVQSLHSLQCEHKDQKEDIDKKNKFGIRIVHNDQSHNEDVFWFYQRNIRNEWLTHLDFCLSNAPKNRNKEETKDNDNTNIQNDDLNCLPGNQSKPSNDNMKSCNTTQIIDAICHHILPKLKNDKLDQHKDKIIKYFSENELDGDKFEEMTRKEFGKAIQNYVNDKKVILPAMKMYKEILSFDFSIISHTNNIETNEMKTDVSDVLSKNNVADIGMCDMEQLIDILSKYVLPNLNNKMLQEHQDKIIEYMVANKMDGTKIKQLTRKQFGKALTNHLNNTKLMVAAMKLYKELVSFDMNKITADENSDSDTANYDVLVSTIELPSNSSNNINIDKDRCHRFVQEKCEIVTDIPEFGLGENVDYWNANSAWYIKHKYKTLRNELLNNQIAPMSSEDYDEIYIKARDFIFDQKKKSKTNNNVRFLRVSGLGKSAAKYFNVKNGDILTIDHMICLLIYTNKTDTQRIFKAKCRKDVEQSMEEFITENSEIAHWCRLLLESCKLYGEKMNKEETFYSGMSCRFLFNSFHTWFICPISTTADKEIAIRFANDTGIILALRCTTQSRYIDTESFSAFSHERERLFCASRLEINKIDTESFGIIMISFQLFTKTVLTWHRHASL